MRYTALFTECEEGGWTVQCAELPAAISEGETLAEARQNLKDAIQTVLEYNAKKMIKRAKADRVEAITVR